MKKLALALAFASLATGASAANLVTNGSFETTAGGATGQVGQGGFSLTGWALSASPGYFFVFNGTTSDSAGANGQYGNVKLWGPGDGSANGLGASQDGGKFIGSDPGFQNVSLTQTINGLISGSTYVVTFDWAGAQQYGFSGATHEGWQVTLGSEVHSTSPQVSIVSHGFSGWQQTSLTFTATASSEVLKFLSIGTSDAGAPPFALLDGVSLTASTPEPAAWALAILGFAGLGYAKRRRRATA